MGEYPSVPRNKPLVQVLVSVALIPGVSTKVHKSRGTGNVGWSKRWSGRVYVEVTTYTSRVSVSPYRVREGSLNKLCASQNVLGFIKISVKV